MKVNDLEVGCGAPPVIVAELSGDHTRSLERAPAIVDAIAASGALIAVRSP